MLFSYRRKTHSTAKLPFISIIIPAYNEEKFIAKKLNNLKNLDYPQGKLEILVVVDGSTDKTASIVKRFRSVKLFSNKVRKGNAVSINFAVTKAKGEFLLITDSDSFFAGDSILKALDNFGNETGAVCGIVDKIFSSRSPILKALNLSWYFMSARQLAESNIDSTLPLLGPFALIKRSAFRNMSTDTFVNDLDLALLIRKAGYKVHTSQSVKVSFYNPASLSRVLKQRRRQIFGATRTLLRFKEFLFNSKYGLFGVFIYPRYLYHTVLKKFLVALFLIYSFYLYSLGSQTISYVLYLIVSLIISQLLFGLTTVIRFNKPLSFLLFSVVRIIYLPILMVNNFLASIFAMTRKQISWR